MVNQRNVLDRIERCSMTSLQSSNDSLRSLGSIANSLSKLEISASTISGCSRSCGSPLNGLVRSVRSQRSLNRFTKNTIDDVTLGSGSRSTCGGSLGSWRDSPVDGEDL